MTHRHSHYQQLGVCVALALAAVAGFLIGPVAAQPPSASSGQKCASSDLILGISLDTSSSRTSGEPLSTGTRAIVDFIADNPTLSYYINYWASSVTELTEEGPVTDVDGDASAAAQMLPERPSGGTRGSLGMEAMTAAMRGPCSRAGVTCVGVFIGDAGAISSIDTSSSLDAAESTYAADFKSSVGRLAVFFVDEDLDAPEAAIAEDVIASAGLYSAGTDFGVLGTLLGNLVAQVCPCPSDPALAVDDPGCGPADEPAAALTPELPPAMPTEAEAPAFADDFPMEAPVSAPDAEERGALPPAAGPSPAPAVDAGTSGQGAYGSYGGSGASPAEDDMGGGYGGTDALEQCIETCYNSYGA